MNSEIKKMPALFAFDLDGTLLNSQKQLSENTISALQQIEQSGSIVAFASGRIKSSMLKYIDQCHFPVAILSLNGADIYMDCRYNFKRIFSSSLPCKNAEFLINHSIKNNITINYYIDNTLFSIPNKQNKPWIELYIEQTGSSYQFIDSFDSLKKQSPSKIIMIGLPEILDEQQRFFTELWGESVYICRTWDYYLEFLNPDANKGNGIKKLANAYSIDIKNVIAFGDADNDIPMLRMAGLSIAVKNATEKVKLAASRVSVWDNDQDVVAHEWNILKEIY